MNDILNKYIKIFKSPRFLVIAGITGILLIFISSFFSGGTSETDSYKSAEITPESYKEMLEADITETVKDITGSKNVSVIITLESGIRYSYADTREESVSEKKENENTISDNELKEGYIIVKSADGGEEALLVTTQMPEVRGVAIVCDGGDNEYICEKIQNAVTAALNITSKRVYICGRNT